MNTMIVGSGGREHALAMAAHEAGAELLFTQPNAGMEQLGQRIETPWTPSGGLMDRVLANSAVGHEVDLAIIGPEEALATGLADCLRDEGIATLGFGIEATRLESSKDFANDFMAKYQILKPSTMVANSVEDALWFAKRRKADDYVIKADGLAGGKGVILPDSKKQARDVICGMMSGEMFGEAGQRLIFQERLHGEEASLIALFDGKRAQVLFLAQDYKRLEDNDKGPNTGGMGSYTEVPYEVVSKEQDARMIEALEKTVHGLKEEGITDPGVIYMGFMLAEEFGGEPALMEYNVRFGDPETQAGLAALAASGVDTHELMHRAALGELGGRDLVNYTNHAGWAALTVCLAAPGYPDNPEVGQPIYGLNKDYGIDVVVHHGATEYRKDEGDRIFAAGGRVLYVTGIGETVGLAAEAAYDAIEDDGLYFDDMQYRRDIGHQAIKARA